MSTFVSREPIAHLIDPDNFEPFDLLGPRVQFLTPATERDGAPCVLRGVLPSSRCVPLHSHHDPETFFVVSGELEGLTQSSEGMCWVGLTTGDIFHVPGGARHAWRNRSRQDAVVMVITTPRLARFLREIGEPCIAGGPPPAPPTAERIRHFDETATRYGYWNATPEENAAVGLEMPMSV
ncbi:MAG: cupin domain-containing protein [Methylobacteriaceae bacterium]|nr:cupin domain-containing protein [Methylobacteriaceae bacterium]